MNRTTQSGFTLLELLVGLCVLSVLLSVAAPELGAVIKNGRIGVLHNELAGSLHLARSEAVKGTGVVTMCARASDTSCGDNWNNGWLVFVDGTTAGTVDVNDTVLRVSVPRTEMSTIRAIGSSDHTSASATTRNYVRFRQSGGADWKSGSFVICDERGAEHARVVNLVLTGNARRGRPLSGSKIAANVFGQAITCPTS